MLPPAPGLQLGSLVRHPSCLMPATAPDSYTHTRVYSPRKLASPVVSTSELTPLPFHGGQLLVVTFGRAFLF